MNRIGYLALAQAHQHPHWIPSALALAQVAGVSVDVLSASKANLDFVARFDSARQLTLRHLPTPSPWRDGLFSPPPRILALWLHRRAFYGYDAIVTTETTSARLKRWGLGPALIEIKHGAGDRAGGYKPAHELFDHILVAGEKDRQRLVDLGLATPDKVSVTGYAKFELAPPPLDLFGDDRPLLLYNPHFDRRVSSWHRHRQAVVDTLRNLTDWNVVVAPHVRLAAGRPLDIPSSPQLFVDPGSERSIDMSYTRAAALYLGDASSQVYEYLRQPRPCLFLNLDRVAWQDDPNYAHWHLGEVIDNIADLAPAIARAATLHPRFEPMQRAAVAQSIDSGSVAASTRQRDAILKIARR